MSTAQRPRAWIVLFTASGLLCCSGYALVDAIFQAYSTGLVEVLPAARYLPRERVSWPSAWALLLGLLLAALGSAMWLLIELRKARLVLVTIGVYCLALPLVLLSGTLVSLGGVAVILGLATAIALTAVVAERFGRTAGLWCWAALVASAFALALATKAT